MITDDGKIYIKRYMAGYTPAIAQSIAFGIGDRVEAATEKDLHFESSRTPVLLTVYNFSTDKIVYKASIPEEYEGKIYEVALYSLEDDPVGGDSGSRIISTFSSDTEEWIDNGTGLLATHDSSLTRIGLDSLVATPAVSTTKTFSLEGVDLDFSGYSGSDQFQFAFNAGNANTSNIQFQFLSDASNYYTLATGAVASSGYKIVEVAKSAATVTGTPDWSSITQIKALVTSGAGGASDIDLDAMRVIDKDSINPEYVMISRKVLAAPVTKVSGMSQDIEFSLDVSIA